MDGWMDGWRDDRRRAMVVGRRRRRV